MKKLYAFILAAMAAVSASAQIVVLNEGTVCKPSETIVIKAVEEAYDLGGGEYFYLVECGTKQPVLKNEGNAKANVKVTIKSADWRNITWCGITGQCMMMGSDTEVRSGKIAAGAETPLQVEGSFAGGPESYGTYNVDVTIESNGKSDTYKLQLVYDASCAAGINEVVADKTHKPIYDISGRRVNRTNPGQIYIRDGKKFIAR